jgi:hypothetical protein
MWIFLFLASVCLAGDNTAVTQARENLEVLRQQAAAGLIPAAKLAEAQQAIDDALDAEVLERTLYGHVEIEKLSPAQVDEMVGAAQRRLDRAEKKLQHDQSLIDQGVAPARFTDDAKTEVARRSEALDQARQRAALLMEIVASAKAETAPAPDAVGIWKPKEFVDGDHLLGPEDIREITLAYEKQFHEPMPVSARGMTEVHRALGLDHTGRIDVAVTPDSPQGVWLRKFLESKGIPYYAFRVAIPGKATGAHIHIGPGSTRLVATD